MKQKNRRKYEEIEHRIHSLGYNPNDIWITKTCSDFKSFRTLYTIKSSTSAGCNLEYLNLNGNSK